MNILFYSLMLLSFLLLFFSLTNLRFRNLISKIFLIISKYIVIAFYICIYSYFAFTYLFKGYSLIPKIYSNSYFLIKFHQIFVFIILPLPWITLIHIYFKNPGFITKDNYEKYEKRYLYDNYLFHENTISKIDSLPVIARSKYCDICNKRIAKYDHYCPWILSTIGEQTQKDFLFFILFNIINDIYFFYVTMNSLIFRVDRSFKELKNNSLFYSKDKVYMMLFIDFASSFSCILLFFVFFGLVGLLIKQIYHISTNKTPYECTKYQLLAKNKSISKPKSHFYDKGFLMNWKEAFTLPLIK